MNLNTDASKDLIYARLSLLSDYIVPRDDHSGSASDAGVPAFILHLCELDPAYRDHLYDGLDLIVHLFSTTSRATFEVASEQEHLAFLEKIAFVNSKSGDSLRTQCSTFFSKLRKDVLNAFFTCRIGIEDLGYQGNTRLIEPSICPDPCLSLPVLDSRDGSYNQDGGRECSSER